MGRYPRLGLFRRPGRADHAAVERALAEVGIPDLAERQIGELSGGQQQRVFIARALVQEPELLLLDEPMSGVDAPTEQAIFDLLDRLRAAGRTVLMSTHDIAGLIERFDRLVFLNRRIVADGPPAKVLTEEHLHAAYGRQITLVRIGERLFALESSAHHS
jgi:manganese/iron transport system ATP-binding protein/manganese/zinc/iron transport system ATP- binding protein